MDVRENLASFVRDVIEKSASGSATDAQLEAMASVANTLVWDLQQRDVSGPSRKDSDL